MNRAAIPNIITIFRIILVIPTVILILGGNYTEALVLFFIAGISDGIDGFLARRLGWASPLGAMLDPLADKLLMASTYLSLGHIGAIPMWLVWLVLGRDLLIIGGAAAYHKLVGGLTMEPQWLSKFNTVVQIAFILAVLSSNAFYPLPSIILDVFILGVAVSTALSGASYVWEWGRRALLAGRAQPGE